LRSGSHFDDLRSSGARKNIAVSSPRRLPNLTVSGASGESLAGDSRDSHRIRSMEALASAHFPNFFSQALVRASSTSVKQPGRRRRVSQQPGGMLR
jgi:hypothetical protein